MSSRSRWLRWVSGLPSSDPVTWGVRMRYMLAEADARRARRWTGFMGDAAGRRYQTAADAALAAVTGGDS